MARVVRGVVTERHRCRWKRKRGPRASGGCASGCTGISFARGDGDRSRVRRRPVADDAQPRRSAAARGSAGPIRGRASSANTGGRRSAEPAPLFRSYSLSGPESTERYRISVKIEPNGAAGTYLRRACPSRRCARRQRAARQLHSAIRRAAGGAAQRGNRGDAGAGDAARAGGGPLDTTGLVAARRSRWAASSLCRRSPPPHARAPARPQLCVLQQASARTTR